MTLARTATLALALVMGGTGVWAQAVVGTAVVDGEKVTLFSNGTWEYVNPKAGDCKVLARNLAFCGSPQEWRRAANAPAHLTAQFIHGGAEYGQMLVEDIGLDQGLTFALMRQAALQYAGQASGQVPEEVPVFADDPIVVDGIDGITLVYLVDFRGTNVVFANTILLTKGQAMQLQTYVLGADGYSEAHKRLHSEFIELIEVSQ